jgi:fermentation-respiration switch protein FrsA (DUF1100 family)
MAADKVDEVRIDHGRDFLAGRLHQPEGQPLAGVVIAHGLLSSMASQKLTQLAGDLAQAGYLACRYDAAGCGDSPGRLEDTTLSSRRDELLAASAWLAAQAPGLDQAYLGSSLGGTAALLAADQRPPQALVCWSTPIDWSELAADPQGPALDALRRDALGHDLEAVLSRASRLCVVHGNLDEVVPVHQARRAYQLAADPKAILLLPQADHRLSRLEDQQKATQATLAWLEKIFPPGP